MTQTVVDPPAPVALAELPLGATPVGGGRTRQLVWAPRAERVGVQPAATERVRWLEPGPRGYHHGIVEGLAAGARYWLRLEQGGSTTRLPDPASRRQPDGVHGPSAVDDPEAYSWSDRGYRPPARNELVIYEVHVGTFTPEGTLQAAIPRLEALAELGITAVELMPLAAFPGRRNWGYDGVFPYAVHESYGGPRGLRAFVDAAHGCGLAVLLDVVYNHLGPEGNVLGAFGPYFTDRYATPWGQAVNFDGPGSDGVRRYVVENAVRWITDFHLDGLRLDATHAIRDGSAVHILEELAGAVHDAAERHRGRAHVFAEDDRRDPRLVRPPAVGGLGCDGMWNDDLHHGLHVALTGEQAGYYADFNGVDDLAACLEHRFSYAGRYSAHRDRRVGRPADDLRHDRLVVCAQNHDQVGNRPAGDRLSTTLGLEAQKLALAVVLLSPFVPLVFMGQEYGETAPFPYFTDHGDPELAQAVREGRRAEFPDWEAEAVPDPQDQATFAAAVLDWDAREDAEHGLLLELTRQLLSVRRESPVLADPRPARVRARTHGRALVATMDGGGSWAVLAANFSPEQTTVPVGAAPGRLGMDTAAARWRGPGGSALLASSRLRLPGHAAVLVEPDDTADGRGEKRR